MSTAHFTGSTADSLSLYFFGGSYEVTDGAVKKYYSFAGQTIAMKDDTGLKYFLTDHLGSIVTMLDAAGTVLSEQRYLPFGGVREDLPIAYRISQTDFGYTGQRSLGGELGLMDYRARFYDPYLSRFLQPDSIIPNPANPQAFNRYSYVFNSPLNYTDPTGHVCFPKAGKKCPVLKKLGSTSTPVSVSDGEGDPCNSLLGCLSFGISLITSTAEYLKDNPVKISKNLTFDFPVVIPSGYGIEPGVFKYSVNIKVAGRVGGRTIGDDLLGPLLFLGYFVTITPSQVENVLQGASWNDYLGDFLVDSGGFIFSEVFGDATGIALSETGPGALAGNFVGDVGAGLWWDQVMETGGRQAVIDAIGELPEIISATQVDYNDAQPVPESPRPWEQIILPAGTPYP